MTEKRKNRNDVLKYPDFTALVGQIAVETVDLEYELSGLFARMLSISLPLARAIFLTPLNERTRLEMLENAANVAFGPTGKGRSTFQNQQHANALKSVRSIVKRSRKAIEKRHRFIHDLWQESGGGESEQTLHLHRIDGRGKQPPIQVTVKELREQSETLRQLIKDVAKLRVAFRERPPTMVSLAKDAQPATYSV